MRKLYFQMCLFETNILWKFQTPTKKNVYFTDQKVDLSYRPFFYRRPYLCNHNSYNVDTYQAHVFGADKPSVKIWYCLLPGCIFYRPESGKFGLFLALKLVWSKRHFGVWMRKLYFHMCLIEINILWKFHTLIVEKRVFYRPESSFGPFF